MTTITLTDKEREALAMCARIGIAHYLNGKIRRDEPVPFKADDIHSAMQKLR